MFSILKRPNLSSDDHEKGKKKRIKKLPTQLNFPLEIAKLLFCFENCFLECVVFEIIGREVFKWTPCIHIGIELRIFVRTCVCVSWNGNWRRKRPIGEICELQSVLMLLPSKLLHQLTFSVFSLWPCFHSTRDTVESKLSIRIVAIYPMVQFNIDKIQ